MPEQHSPTLRAWRPEGGTTAVLLRWLMTEWCNYRCPYCPQTHDRRADKGGGMTAHAFDNFPVEQWLEAFDRHFAATRLSLVLTGGEPMVDRRNMLGFLNHISASAAVECIRIDTNLWWRPEQFPGLDHGKIILMCTFHPSQVEEAVFIERLRAVQRAGLRIGMVNYVLDDDNEKQFEERAKLFAGFGVTLHPNPLWNRRGDYSEAGLALVRRMVPEHDYLYRTGLESPQGKPCHFPSIGYEMDAAGRVTPGCLYDRTGSFFDHQLPEGPPAAVPCPFQKCVCLDKYSFLDGFERNISTNPLGEYAKALVKKQAVLF
jgi:hypothetical protein